MAKILEVKDLVKKYKDKEVLSGISFDVNQNEIFSYIGKNGIGKSTTIKAIVGIHDFDNGDIFLNGVSIKKDPLYLKSHIGFVDDSSTSYEEMSAKEFIEFIGSIYNVDKKEFYNRYYDLIKKFEIEDSMEKPIKTFSHGMKQKVVLISSLIHEPDLWILDEPFTGLDIVSSKTLIDLMLEHKNKGKAILLTSHNLDIVSKISDRVAFLNNGHITNILTKEELKDKKDSLDDIFFDSIGEHDA